jgi:hypothetical protein
MKKITIAILASTVQIRKCCSEWTNSTVMVKPSIFVTVFCHHHRRTMLATDKNDAQPPPPLASTSTIPTPQNMCKDTLEEDFICTCIHFTTATLRHHSKKPSKLSIKWRLPHPHMTTKACFCSLLSLLVVLGLISVEKSGRSVPREGSNSQRTTITSLENFQKKIPSSPTDPL